MWQAPSHLLPKLQAAEPDSFAPTESQSRALRTLGINAASYTSDQHSLILAARDYADCIMGWDAPPGWHYKEARLTLLCYVVEQVDHAWLLKWSASQSLRSGDDDPKRVPANDVRTLVRARLARMR